MRQFLSVALAGKEGEEEEGKAFKVVSKKSPPAGDIGPPDLRNDLERVILLEASPILKKVALNPKVYLWFDYAKTELGFKGDVGDFLIDTVEDFFKSRGFQIVISRTKEVAY